jgi:hypothetical protein
VIKTGKAFGIILILLSALTASASVSVQSMVDRNEMGLGDTLTLTVAVNSTDSVEVNEPRVPQLNDFDLVNSWTSSSTSSKLIQGANGMQFDTVRAQNFNYMITPKKAGRLTIPAFEVVVESKTYNTKPIIVQVSTQGSGATQRPRNLPAPPMGEEEGLDEAEQMFQQLLQRHGTAQQPPSARSLPKNANEALSIQLEVDKTEVYEGEQIVANWYIYTRGNLMALDRLKFPDLKGFWKEIIEEVPALNFTQEVINGIPYRKALLASHALFPIKPGIAVIDEYKIKGQVQVPANPFSALGFGQAYSFQRASDRVKINVKPLPNEGKPKDFSGAVGQFDVQSSVEGSQFPVNQPFTLKVRFEGSGNAKLIELPTLNLPNGVELYDTKNESKYFKNGRSYKQFDVLIIPRQEGLISIPAMSFSTFDPAQKRYISRSTQPIEVKVIANPNAGNISSSRIGTNTPAVAAAEGKQVPKLPDLVLSWQSQQSLGFHQPWIWLVAFVVALGVLGFKFHQEMNDGQKKKDLRELLQSRMKRVNGALAASDYRKVGTEMSNLIYLILGEIAGVGGAGLDIQKLLDHAPPSLRRELGSELIRLVDIFQILSFAPEEAVGKLRDAAELKKHVSVAADLLQKAVSGADQGKS